MTHQEIMDALAAEQSRYAQDAWNATMTTFDKNKANVKELQDRCAEIGHLPHPFKRDGLCMVCGAKT